MDAIGGGGFVPTAWAKSALEMASSESFLSEHLRRQRLGDEVGFGGDWDTVVFPDGEEFSTGRGDEIYCDMGEDLDGLRCIGKKTVKREVPDEAALADFAALLDKWRAEGKIEAADRVEDLRDDYGEGVRDCLVSWVDDVVEREADAAACKFYRSTASKPWGTVSIPKIGNIEIVTTRYEAAKLTESDA